MIAKIKTEMLIRIEIGTNVTDRNIDEELIKETVRNSLLEYEAVFNGKNTIRIHLDEIEEKK